MSLEYNTSREHLLLKEYGRNVQQLIEHILTIEDRKKRTDCAAVLVKLMVQLNPSIKMNGDNLQRVWDHMHVMSGFKLDIDGPFPAPTTDITILTPDKVDYRIGEVSMRHYGRNIEQTIKKAAALTDLSEEEQRALYIQLARNLKSFYYAWYQETLDDAAVISDLKALSGGVVDVSEEYARNPRMLEMQLNTVATVPNRESHNHNTGKRGNSHNHKKRKRKK